MAKRGIGALAHWGSNESVVRRYAEKAVRRTSFAGYHYFWGTDNFAFFRYLDDL